QAIEPGSLHKQVLSDAIVEDSESPTDDGLLRAIARTSRGPGDTDARREIVAGGDMRLRLEAQAGADGELRSSAAREIEQRTAVLFDGGDLCSGRLAVVAEDGLVIGVQLGGDA